MTIIFKITAFK